jgi:hypothetical protein
MKMGTQLSPRIARMLAYLPGGHARSRVTAKQLTVEVRQEIWDYYRIYESIAKVSERLGLNRHTIRDVLLLHQLRVCGLVCSRRLLCSQERLQNHIASLPTSAKERYRLGGDFFEDLRADVLNDFCVLESSKEVARRYRIPAPSVLDVILFALAKFVNDHPEIKGQT